MPSRPLRVLLQTTIPPITDDWHIGRFRLLCDYLAGLTDTEGRPLCEVIARDRAAPPGNDDPVLAGIDRSDIDQLWLFAVDAGDGLTRAECRAIDAFRRRGGGLMVTRDHMDLGLSVATLAEIGAAHYFHSRNADPDPDRCCIDDSFTARILWPNYHSGANGDYQRIEPVVPFDPRGAAAGSRPGRAVAQSTFHHFCDYNWDIDAGCPSFVDEPPGDGMRREPAARRDIERYARNLVLWLAREDAA